MRIHRTLSSCFAQFTQQISSVSTEQFQAGVNAQRTPSQNESLVEKFAAKENEQLLKNVKPQEVNSLERTPRSDNRAIRKQIAKMSSEIRNIGGRNPKREFVKLRHSGEESLLG